MFPLTNEHGSRAPHNGPLPYLGPSIPVLLLPINSSSSTP